jgi:hypothetical protein
MKKMKLERQLKVLEDLIAQRKRNIAKIQNC